MKQVRRAVRRVFFPPGGAFGTRGASPYAGSCAGGAWDVC